MISTRITTAHNRSNKVWLDDNRDKPYQSSPIELTAVEGGGVSAAVHLTSMEARCLAAALMALAETAP